MGQQLPRRDEEVDPIGLALPHYRHGRPHYMQDTEFPGIIANRCEVDQRYYSEQECEYFLVKRNVEETKMIQIGLSIADENGATPLPTSTWQFNFKFDKEKDRIVDQSYDLLIKAGVRFDRLATEGIDYSLFAEYFAGSCTWSIIQLWCSTKEQSGWFSTAPVTSPTS